eukprot:573987-Amphidinium_carterae.1
MTSQQSLLADPYWLLAAAPQARVMLVSLAYFDTICLEGVSSVGTPVHVRTLPIANSIVAFPGGRRNPTTPNQ